MGKRIISILTVLCLLSFCAGAETVTIGIPSVYGGIRAMAIEFNEDFFAKSSYEYDHGLMRTTIALSQAGNGGGDAYGADGDFKRERYALDAFEKLGFTDAATANYEISLNDTSDKVAFSIARRALSDGSELVLALVRSANYGAEWASNFNVGAGETHEGFTKSAKGVTDALLNYIETRVESDRAKIWITGYSRGAAVANLAARTLDEEAAKGNVKFKAEDVFAYTFATPATVREGMANESDALYDNIFNIVSDADIVTELPLAGWGYARFGRTLRFAKFDGLATVGELSETYKPAMDRYVEITGMKFDMKQYSELRGMVNETITGMRASIREIDDYAENWQNLFTSYMRVLNTQVNSSSISDAAFAEIQEKYADKAWLAALKKERGRLTNGWAQYPLTAYLSIYGADGGDMLSEAGTLVDSLMPVGSDAYSVTLAYVALGLKCATEIESAGGGNAYMRLGSYMPLLQTLSGLEKLFAGHMPDTYIAFLTSMSAEELFS